MILYYMILLFLSWPLSKCMEDTDLNSEEIFDQLATASENIALAVRQTNESSKHPREQLSSVPSSLDATVHYENSNGFVPIIPSTSPSYDPDSSSLRPNDLEDNRSKQANATNAVSARNNSDTRDTKKLEEDLAYSSEARIFLSFPGSLTNRRSFDFQEDEPNEFELLKVNNDTPAVANYKDFYENVRGTVNADNSKTGESSSSGRASRQHGKGIEGYGNGYGNPYVQYYMYNGAQNAQKTTYEQEKVAANYRPQDTVNYNSHGQGATKQNAAVAAASSSSRTNYGVNEFGGTHGGTYDSIAESSKTRHRFSRPVVVAEPSNYNMDAQKFNSQLRDIGLDNDYKTSRNLESSSSETSERQEAFGDNSKQRSYNHAEDSRNLSDESMEYTEYVERPKVKMQKSPRRRPASHSEAHSSRKPSKEHRVTTEESVEEQEKVHKYSSSRVKPQRYRIKANPWANDPTASNLDESVEDIKYDSRGSGTGTKSVMKMHHMHHTSRPKHTWSQISPSLEISHSSGIELDQVEKPKFVLPVNVNLVPLANFDHATALGNSQGFDMSNVLQNFVTASPIGAFSTAASVLSTPQPVLTQNLALQKNLQNVHNLHGVSTSVPDVIVGQNSFHNPVHAVLLSQPTGQNKVADTLRTNYLPSTMGPVFALTSSLAPALQSVPIQNVQASVTPRTAFAVTPTPTPIVQQLPVNQLHSGVQQLQIVPQPTIQTYLQTPFQTSPAYQIQVNPHGLQGQNLINHNLQVQSLPTVPTLSGQPENRINLIPVNSQDKKNAYPTSDTSFLASASLTVGQNEQKQLANNINSYYLHQPTNPQDGAYQVNINMTPKTKTFVHATQVVPTIMQPGMTLNGLPVNTQQVIPTQQNLQDPNFILQRPRDQTQQYIKLHTASGVDNAQQQQLQVQINKQLMKNNRLPSMTWQTADSTASYSNNVNNVNTMGSTSSGTAHLPHVGTKNVQILNPNIKPSPIDTTMNTYETIQYPTTVLTTPIPFFSTVTPITPQTVSLQSYVDSLTENGAKSKQVGNFDLKSSQNQERPTYNPINFVPNADIIKNQNALNNKPTNEPVQQGLNLVPVMPGGNFFKPTYAAQNELVMKPKLASDLQQYAEEMFKESLKTMYNSQKWNNDRRQQVPTDPQVINQNNSEASDLAKLRIELQKLRASISENTYRDLLEAHQSENKIRMTDAPKSMKSGSNKKKPEVLLATLEHLMKTRPPGPIHIFHGSSRPNHKNKSSRDTSFGTDFHDDFESASHVREYLTPPRPNSFHKSPFHDQPKPKKRPGSSRFKNGSRKPVRSNHSPPRTSGLESSGSTIDIHLDDSHYHGLPFERDNFDYNSRHQSLYDAYQSSPSENLSNILRELKSPSSKDYDINHPRMHNLLGLLMKNKQLPTRSAQGQHFRDKEQLSQYFESEKRRLQQQFYDDNMKDYLDRADGTLHQTSGPNRKVYSRIGAA